MNAMRLISFQRSSHARAAMCPAVPAARTAAPQAQQPAAPADLTLENLSVSYGAPGTRQAVVRNFSLHVPAGEVHAIMGPNGAGKSTLSNVLGGKPGYEVTAGSVTFRLLVAAALRAGLDPDWLKAATAVVVLAALVAPRFLARGAKL